ncbi:MAG: prevent-host-death protein [Patescibacteria group bacterium]|jgi:prevent-host-death family protein
MQTLTVGNLKTHFSEVLTKVRQGEDCGISFGKKKEPVAVIVPIERYVVRQKKLGVSEQRGAKIIIKKNFKMTDEEFLRS